MKTVAFLCYSSEMPNSLRAYENGHPDGDESWKRCTTQSSSLWQLQASDARLVAYTDLSRGMFHRSASDVRSSTDFSSCCWLLLTVTGYSLLVTDGLLPAAVANTHGQVFSVALSSAQTAVLRHVVCCSNMITFTLTSNNRFGPLEIRICRRCCCCVLLLIASVSVSGSSQKPFGNQKEATGETPMACALALGTPETGFSLLLVAEIMSSSHHVSRDPGLWPCHGLYSITL